MKRLVFIKRLVFNKRIAKMLSVLSLLSCSQAIYAESVMSNNAFPIQMVATDTSANVDAKVDRHLRRVLAQTNIKTDIVSINPSNLPNMYQVNLVGQPPLHITADGRYVVQGELQKNPNQSKRPAHRTPTRIASSQVGMPLDSNLPFFYTAVPGVLWSASAEGIAFLVSDDGQYLIDSEISVIENNQFMGLDKRFEQRKNQFVLSTLDESQLITYPAISSERAIVYVATDVNCPYCRKLHQQVNKLNTKGVTVKMIGYPLYKESPKQMRAIWCQPDKDSRRKALDDAMLAGKMTPAPVNCMADYITPNRKRAAGLAVFATPMIFREDGVPYQASFESPEFLEFLGIK